MGDENYKIILLSKGEQCLVSLEDYEELSKYKWYYNNTYASGMINGETILMHRYITKCPKGFVVDHINSNRLDNTRENLRITTNAMNKQNRSISKSKKSSQYHGVFFSNGKYNVTINGIRYGFFETELEAVITYDMHVVHNNLEFRKLNFPEKRQEYLNMEYIPYQNRKTRKTSEYFGVHKPKGKKYIARININKKSIKILRSYDQVECARAYDKYIVDNNIPNKELNFPDEHPNYDPLSIIKTKCEIIDDETVNLLISDEKCLIDKEDYDKIKYYYCHIIMKYIQVVINNKRMGLSRFIMNVTDPKILVDHIDGNKLNNKKNNLRFSNTQLNNQNKKKCNRDTTSKYIGVCLNGETWKSSIKFNGKVIYSFSNIDEETVARGRDLFILAHKEYHFKLNFDWTDEKITYWNDKVKKCGKRKRSKYNGISLDKKTYCCCIFSNKEKVFSFRNKDEIITARRRDLFIIMNLDIDRYKLNFDWTDGEIEYWENFFEEL